LACPSGIDLALVLEPTVAFTPGEWELLHSWVEEGGTLLLAGTGAVTIELAEQLDVRFGLAPSSEAAVSNQTPLLQAPPLGSLSAESSFFLRPERDDFVTLLANRDWDTLPRLPLLRETAVSSSPPSPSRSATKGCKLRAMPALVLNLLNAAPDVRGIWFNEWHHGIRPEAEGALTSSNWLQRTPVGRALLLVLAIIFIGLVLRGRHFGRPVPLRKDVVRRAPLEYITGIANLSRRAGHRTAVLQHYHDRLKRDLGAALPPQSQPARRGIY
jgi:hypothetical protein